MNNDAVARQTGMVDAVKAAQKILFDELLAKARDGLMQLRAGTLESLPLFNLSAAAGHGIPLEIIGLTQDEYQKFLLAQWSADLFLQRNLPLLDTHTELLDGVLTACERLRRNFQTLIGADRLKVLINIEFERRGNALYNECMSLDSVEKAREVWRRLRYHINAFPGVLGKYGLSSDLVEQARHRRVFNGLRHLYDTGTLPAESALPTSEQWSQNVWQSEAIVKQVGILQYAEHHCTLEAMKCLQCYYYIWVCNALTQDPHYRVDTNKRTRVSRLLTSIATI